MIKVIFPEYISLKDIAAALVFDYPDEPLPILEDEANWQEWGQIVAGTGIFARAAVPPPFSIVGGKKESSFGTWQDWFKTLYTVMSNELDIPKNIIG